MTIVGFIHLVLHLLVPFVLARLVCGKAWRTPFYVMLLTMLVDIDHLLATPLYDPERCSINYHPLHRWPLWFIYGLLAALPKTRWLGVGLMVHMVLDASDCVRQRGLDAFISGFDPIW
ncbi:hypothetical protein R50072_27380 [Simiduia litorea]|uniref:DUF6122 family protein n=1 Tax=Simiduia litorea TaxID=1435348 RepID=UPI0036F417A9